MHMSRKHRAQREVLTRTREVIMNQNQKYAGCQKRKPAPSLLSKSGVSFARLSFCLSSASSLFSSTKEGFLESNGDAPPILVPRFPARGMRTSGTAASGVGLPCRLSSFAADGSNTEPDCCVVGTGAATVTFGFWLGGPDEVSISCGPPVSGVGTSQRCPGLRDCQ